MMTETVPLLLMAKQLQTCRHYVDSAQCYWIQLLQKDYDTSSADKQKDQMSVVDSKEHKAAPEIPAATCITSDKVDGVRSRGAESLRSVCSLDVDCEWESGLYVLRPSLLPQIGELLTKKEEFTNNAESVEENRKNIKSAEGEENGKEKDCGGCNVVNLLLFGISGLVFKNVAVNLWALPAFHELILTGVFPSECEPVRLLGERLETLLAPYGICLVTEQEALSFTAPLVGLVGKVFASNGGDNINHTSVTVSLNLDFLAVLFFSLPDWRLLWSRDPRFLKQFATCPLPGTPFRPFSLFPEHFNFDISFWTGPTWEEKMFHAVVREASCGTVEQVKIIDTFSHPDLSQTSYCYRLIYYSHTHALSHTQALQFHKHLESLLSSRFEVTIR